MSVWKDCKVFMSVWDDEFSLTMLSSCNTCILTYLSKTFKIYSIISKHVRHCRMKPLV